jgi:hypothetical protein
MLSCIQPPVNLAVASVLFLLPLVGQPGIGAVGFSLGLPLFWLTIAGLLKARRSAEVSDLALARVADQLAIAVGAQWEAEACIHHLNDPCLLPVSWAAADVSLADPWDQLEMLPDTGVAQLASPSPGTWATSPDDLASPPSAT